MNCTALPYPASDECTVEKSYCIKNRRKIVAKAQACAIMRYYWHWSYAASLHLL